MIYLGDCLEIMDKIPDNSIDMVLCDLPYGKTACAWDVVIPFDKLWQQYNRIVKDGGGIVLTASQPFTSALIMSNPKQFRHEWIWEKPQGTNPLQAKFAPMKNHESIIVFSNGRVNYYPQMESGQPYKGFHSSDSKIGEVFNSLNSIHYENKGTRYPKNVQKFKQERQRLHPTQKPIALMEYLIKTYSKPGDTVLDNCMGSGTTGVACKKTGRKFIGIELNEKYFKIAKQRIEAQE